ncbi:MAG TPA: autotransporter-associated beta strand repeat-containing protein, partial [Bauldia sp.]|nr:autotransporter-associated beta strand repeat-containing protein [Bauldia sp.]
GGGTAGGTGGTYGGTGGSGQRADGGGGAGLGGAVFVRSGGTLILKETGLTGTYSVTGGAAGDDGTGGATAGRAVGNVMFLDTGTAVTVEVTTGNKTIGGGTTSGAGDIAGQGGLIKTGAGSLTLVGDNTYAGATEVRAGTLFAASSQAFSSKSVFSVAAGATLDINGYAVSISGLTDYDGAGGLVTNADSVHKSFTLTGDDSYTVFSGTIADGDHNIGLVKAGSGTQVLKGTNAYSLATEISGGILQIDGSVTSTTFVENGGMLAGSGTLATVEVQTGGTLTPGDAPIPFGLPPPGGSTATMKTGSLSMASGATLIMQIAGASTYDALEVTGGVELNGATLDLSLVDGFVPNGGFFTLIDNDGIDGVDGTFAGLAEGARFAVRDRLFTISYSAGDGNDVVVYALRDGVTVRGTAGADLIDATHAPKGQPRPGAGGDTIFGKAGNDRLHGLGGDDTIVGGMGTDRMWGNGGADTFVFRSLAEVGGSLYGRGGAAPPDQIFGFVRGEDRIDLAKLDASTAQGIQNFTFIGKQGFHGEAGELRYTAGGAKTVVLQGDVNGDGRPDFSIVVHGTHAIGTGDLILV